MYGHTKAMFDSIYKFWYRNRQRKIWEAAAHETHDGDLARWIRDTLDAGARKDLSPPSND